MGLLGHCASECSILDPNHLLPSPQTCYRITQIETQKNRLFRQSSNVDGYGIHSGSHLERGFNVRLVLSGRHRPSRPRWSYRCRFHFRRMEICRSSHNSSPSSFAAITFGSYSDCVPCWMLLLCQCLFSSNLLPDHTQSPRWSAPEFGTATVSSPPSNRDCNGGGIHCSKVFFLLHILTDLCRLGHYNPVLWVGYAIWCIAAGVQTTFARSTTHAYIVGILFVEGFGVGWTFQTALVAAQAIAPAKDRAAITGIRNLFRFTGGSFGLAISSAIMNNVINSKLAVSDLSKSIVDQINGAEFTVPVGLTSVQAQTVLGAEMAGVKGVFWFLLAVSLSTFLLSLIVEDHGLPEDKKKSEGKVEAPQENGESQDGEESESQEAEENREKTDLEAQR